MRRAVATISAAVGRAGPCSASAAQCLGAASIASLLLGGCSEAVWIGRDVGVESDASGAGGTSSTSETVGAAGAGGVEPATTATGTGSAGSGGGGSGTAWASSIGGEGYELFGSMAVAADDTAFVLGSFRGSITIGSDTLETAFTEALFVARIAPTGEPVWAKRIGEGGPMVGAGIALDFQGDVVVVSSISSPGVFDVGLGPVSTVGLVDAFIARLDPDGAPIWARSLATPDDDLLTSVATGPDGSIAAAGAITGELDLGGSCGVVSSSPGASDDLLLVQLDANGGCQWAKVAGDGADQVGRSVAVGEDASVFMTARLEGSTELGPQIPALTASGGWGDVVVARFDGAGTPLYAEAIAPAGWLRVAVGPGGRAFLTGSVPAPPYIPTSGVFQDGADVLLAELDPHGAPLWGRLVGGGDVEQGWSLARLPSGDLLVAGDFAGTLDFGSTHLVSDGADAFVGIVGPDGEPKQAIGLGGAEMQHALAVHATSAGGALVGGYFGGTMLIGDASLPSAGWTDVFLARLEPMPP